MLHAGLNNDVTKSQLGRDLKQDDAFNTTWWPVLSINKCCQVTNLSIERSDHHVLAKASCCLSSLLRK